jgi:hypothetical protein
MRRVARLLLVALFVAVSLTPLPGQEAKPPAANDPPITDVIEINPVGEPAPYARRGNLKGPHYFVWYDAGGWHLRTTTKEISHEFSGTIRVVGGTVTKIENFSGLEARPGQKGKNDIGRLDESRRNITFKFATKGREDGFDFKVGPTAETLQFNLKVNGYGHREMILIGGEGTAAPQAAFSLPAQPGREAAAP